MRTVTVIGLVALALAVVTPASGGNSHRNVCHTRHTCPSDHASYRWTGWLCVAKTADERTAAFKKRVVYQGRVYFCRR